MSALLRLNTLICSVWKQIFSPYFMFLSTGSSYKLGFHYSKPAAHKVSSTVFILHSLFFLKYWWISYFTFILRERPNFEMKNSHFKVLFLKGEYYASLHSSFLAAESGKLILLYPSFKMPGRILLDFVENFVSPSQIALYFIDICQPPI